MNLSDLVTTAPEARKTKSPDTNAGDGETPSAEAGEFFGLTVDLSNRTPEGLTRLAVSDDIQDAQVLKTENASLIDEEQAQDPGILSDLPDDEAPLASDVEVGQPTLPVGLATLPGNSPDKPTQARLSDQNSIIIAESKTGKQLLAIPNAPSEADSMQNKAAAAQASSGAVLPIGEGQPPFSKDTDTAQTIGAARTIHQTSLMNVQAGQVSSMTGSRTALQDTETSSPRRTNLKGLTADSEDMKPRTTDVVRAVPELSTSTSVSAGTTAEPRILQFLIAQGALQPLGSEPLLVSGQSSTAPPAAQTSSNNVVAGALSSEISAQFAQRTVLPQIAGSMQAIQNGGVIDLMLDPPELGRIEILIELTDKVLRATLTADRSGTSDLIRRHAEDLMQQLSDAGFSDVDLNFADQHDGSTESGVPRTVSDHSSEENSPLIESTRKTIIVDGHGRVDLRL